MPSPGDVIFDAQGHPVGVLDDNSELAKSGTVEFGHIQGDLLGFGVAAMSFAHMGQVVAAAADEVRRVIEEIRKTRGGQSWPTLTMSNWTWHRLTHTKLRGREATKWIQSRTPAQLSRLRLISQPSCPTLSTKRAAKRTRIRERHLTELYRSFQKLSQ